MLKNILSYCGYSPTSPFFFLLSVYKHCDNMATNSNSEHASSRMVASLWGSVGVGTKKDKSSTGRFWTARFHHVTARSPLAHVLKLTKILFLEFSKFYFGPRWKADNWHRGYWIREYGSPPVFVLFTSTFKTQRERLA